MGRDGQGTREVVGGGQSSRARGTSLIAVATLLASAACGPRAATRAALRLDGTPDPAREPDWWKNDETACPPGTVLDAYLPPFPNTAPRRWSLGPVPGARERVECTPPVDLHVPVPLVPSAVLERRAQVWPWERFFVPYRARCVRRDDLVPHGRWKTWYRNGAPAGTGEYRNGELHGEVTYWLASGAKVVTVTYRHGVRHGPARAWHPGGALAARAAFAHGALVGPCIEWDADGRKTVDADYPWGLWKRLYPNGDLAVLAAFDAAGTGEVTTWEPGKRKFSHSQFRSFKLNGTQEFFRDDTFAYDRREFVDGRPTGVWTTWHAPGVIESEVRFAAGAWTALWWCYWDENGKPEAGSCSEQRRPEAGR